MQCALLAPRPAVLKRRRGTAPGSGSPGWRRGQQRVAPDRVISAGEPEARHAHKSVSRRQDGCQGHLAVVPDTGIITYCALTTAAGAGRVHRRPRRRHRHLPQRRGQEQQPHRQRHHRRGLHRPPVASPLRRRAAALNLRRLVVAEQTRNREARTPWDPRRVASRQKRRFT